MPSLDEIVDVRMISGWQTSDGHHMGALRVTLAPGWKTYWRAASRNGFPPVFHWHGSENIGDVEFLWPRPEILLAAGAEMLGFRHELVLPIRFRPGHPGEVIHARGAVELGVCREVCMPIQVPFSAELTPSDADTRFLIELSLANMPETTEEPGAHCRLIPQREGYVLEAAIDLVASGRSPEIAVVELAMDGVWAAPAQLRRQGDRIIVKSELLRFDGKPFEPDVSSLRLTLIDPTRAVEIGGCRSVN